MRSVCGQDLLQSCPEWPVNPVTIAVYVLAAPRCPAGQPRYRPSRSSTASWVLYALVVATAISGPAQVYSTSSDSLGDGGAHHVDDGQGAAAPPLGLPQGGHGVQRLAGLADDDDQGRSCPQWGRNSGTRRPAPPPPAGGAFAPGHICPPCPHDTMEPQAIM